MFEWVLLFLYVGYYTINKVLKKFNNLIKLILVFAWCSNVNCFSLMGKAN